MSNTIIKLKVELEGKLTDKVINGLNRYCNDNNIKVKVLVKSYKKGD